MAEEMALCNGPLPRERDETSVKINAGMAETCIPDQCFCLHTHRLRIQAIVGIVFCCCPCLGVLALMYAVKAREKEKANSKLAKYWAKKSCCMCMLSVGVCIATVVLVLLSIILISYVISQAE